MRRLFPFIKRGGGESRPYYGENIIRCTNYMDLENIMPQALHLRIIQELSL